MKGFSSSIVVVNIILFKCIFQQITPNTIFYKITQDSFMEKICSLTSKFFLVDQSIYQFTNIRYIKEVIQLWEITDKKAKIHVIVDIFISDYSWYTFTNLW